MINRRNLLWLVPAMAMVSAPLWWPLAHQFLEPRGDFSVPPSISGPRDQIFTMENMTLSQHRGEVEELRVTAARVRTGDNQKDMEMEEVTAVAPGAADNGPLRIRGNSGIYDS